MYQSKRSYIKEFEIRGLSLNDKTDVQSDLHSILLIFVFA